MVSDYIGNGEETSTNNDAGTSKTFVDKITTSAAVAGRAVAFQQFLRLVQPLSESDLPEDMVFKAGKTYNIPFVFVVPQQLLLRVCRHEVSNDQIRDAHLTVPPSLGDATIAGRGEKLLDDFAPDMAAIKYAVNVKIDQTEGKPIVKGRKVRIAPAAEEQPPVSVEGALHDYIMRAEKDVKKGLLKGKLGRLVLEVAQPKSIRLPSHQSKDQAPPSTMATIMLRFDPAEARSPPPRLGSLSSRLKVQTFYASAARTDVPTRKSLVWDASQGMHSDNVTLPSRHMTGVEWTYHETEEQARLTRQTSSTSDNFHPIPAASEKYQGAGFYTAQILVPISLPTNKVFVPTFHTCLVSRVYSLSLHLGLHSVSMAPTVDLKVPVQISAEPSAEAQRRVSLIAEQEAFEVMDADNFFQTRTISPMAEHLIGRSSLTGASDLPPDYENLASGGMRIPCH